ncbi:MAG TPA: AfsR/SARP family transcriptional regulator [Micromonosporaceae bacterium]|nr:AfsR/SARP family transcriptional regulator [Micromonosporaceae bacterium]
MGGRRGVRLLLLGDFEVWVDGRRVRVGQPKQQALLALLALRRGSLVPVHEIIDALWDDTPPNRVRNQVQVYVAGLRRVLAAAGAARDLIDTRGRAYLLDTPSGAVDLSVFEQIAASAGRLASVGALPAAARSLEAALAIWRGPPLGGVTGRFFEQAAVGLEERRLAVLEQHMEVMLALGHHAGLVSRLRATVAAHPLHERFRYGLMLALYRCGRRAEALAVYRQGRRRIVGELGIEPGAELRTLELCILRGEPAPASTGLHGS